MRLKPSPSVGLQMTREARAATKKSLIKLDKGWGILSEGKSRWYMSLIFFVLRNVRSKTTIESVMTEHVLLQEDFPFIYKCLLLTIGFLSIFCPQCFLFYLFSFYRIFFSLPLSLSTRSNHRPNESQQWLYFARSFYLYSAALSSFLFYLCSCSLFRAQHCLFYRFSYNGNHYFVFHSRSVLYGALDVLVLVLHK